ncbi:MAG TPA: hypothetical protein VD813_10380 [Pseudonocardia sp.]|nr:hypothetical protein [Pseudonocardia sp.]
MTADSDHATALALAARLLAERPDGVAQILAAHRERPDGRCTACGPTPTPWPCFVLSAARAASRSPGRTNGDGCGTSPSSGRGA